MKINDIYELIKDWDQEHKSIVLSSFSGHDRNSYYGEKIKNPKQWIIENFEYLKANKELEINKLEPKYEYKIFKFIVNLMGTSEIYKNNNFIDFFKTHQLESNILPALDAASRFITTVELRSQYYLSFRNLLENNFFNLNSPEVQDQIKKTFKNATIENNKKQYAHSLFKVAEFFYENKDTLDKSFVLEMIEYYLITGKYLKPDLSKVLEMSNWREKELSMGEETIECSCIIKKINPVKMSIVINEEKGQVERMLKKMHEFLQIKLYTQEQHLAIDVNEKAADKIFMISFEKRTSKVQSASDFISYFSENNIKQEMYEEIWNKIEFKNKIEDKLPPKNQTNFKNKI